MTIKIWAKPDNITDPSGIAFRQWFVQAWEYVRKTIFASTEGKAGISPTDVDNAQSFGAADTPTADFEIRSTNIVTTPRKRLRLKGGNSSLFYYLDVEEEFYNTGTGDMRWNIAVNSFNGRGGLTTQQNAVSIDGSGAISFPFGQLTFPATQNPSSNVNTLDDYEEGTWTPTVGGTVTNGTYTYTIQTGTYTKIGNTVYFTGRVIVSAITVAATGSLVINGLPFTQVNTVHSSGAVAYTSGWNNIAPTSYLIPPLTSRLELYKWASTVTFNRTPSAPADVAVNADIIFSGFFFTT
jgi:hypothetical protein